MSIAHRVATPTVTRLEIAELFTDLRDKHLQMIKHGRCLCCGHYPHRIVCEERDFWSGMCACTSHEVRT